MDLAQAAERPPGLPKLDARTPESPSTAKYLAMGAPEGALVASPTPEQEHAVEQSIVRQIERIGSCKITKPS